MYKDMYLDKEELLQNHTLIQKTDYATQQTRVYHPLETRYDSVVDEQQLSYRGSILVT
jgi:hypothetical protein